MNVFIIYEWVNQSKFNNYSSLFLSFLHLFSQYACSTLDQKWSTTDSAIDLHSHFCYSQFFVFSLPIITLDMAGNIHCKWSRTFFSFIQPTDLYLLKLKNTFSCINSSSWSFFILWNLQLLKTPQKHTQLTFFNMSYQCNKLLNDKLVIGFLSCLKQNDKVKHLLVLGC